MRKLNVGDRALVKSMEWYDTQERSASLFVTSQKKYLGKIVTISKIDTFGAYNIVEDGGYWYWTDEMFDSSYYFDWKMKNFPDYIECRNILSSKIYEDLKYSKIPEELLKIQSIGLDSSIVKKFEKLYICKEAYLILANSLFPFPNWQEGEKYSLIITINTGSAHIKFMTIEFPTKNMREVFVTKFRHLINDFKISAEADDLLRQFLDSSQYEKI